MNSQDRCSFLTFGPESRWNSAFSIENSLYIQTSKLLVITDIMLSRSKRHEANITEASGISLSSPNDFSSQNL